MRRAFLTLLAAISIGSVLAQASCPDSTPVLESGRLRALVDGTGLTFAPDYDGSVFYTNSGGIEAGLVFAQGIWIGAQVPGGETAMAAQGYIGLGGDQGDFYSGTVDTTNRRPDTASLFCSIAKVTRAQIEAHLADLEDGRLDDPIPAILAWPGAGNVAYDVGTHDLAPFVDADGDGVYEPAAGDVPAITGDHAVWWVMNDFGNNNESGSARSPEVEVQGLLEGFDSDASPELSSALKLSYRITSRNRERLDSLAIGLWQDVDLGCPEDDYVGSLPSLEAIYSYNADTVDGVDGRDCGATTTFGAAPPVLVSRLLGVRDQDGDAAAATGAIAMRRPTPSVPVPEGMIGPTKGRPDEFYNLLRARYTDGTPITAAGIGYDTDGPITSWIYDGNPADSMAWSACGSVAGDFWTVLSARPSGPLLPGHSVTVEYALFALDDIPLPCPNAEVIAEATERLTERLLARPPIVSSVLAASGPVASIRVYPNPSGAAGFAVRLPTLTPGARLEIADAAGRSVRTYVTTGEVQEVRGLAPGVYVARLTDASGARSAQRIIVQ